MKKNTKITILAVVAFCGTNSFAYNAVNDLNNKFQQQVNRLNQRADALIQKAKIKKQALSEELVEQNLILE